MYILDPSRPLEFEWDAARVFARPTIESRSNRDGEERWIVVGEVQGREVAVVYTVRDGRYRIISARRARRNERRAYRAAHPGNAGRGAN